MFKMKGLPWYLKSLAFFSLLFNITTAKGAQADELLDQKEKELTDFVAAVEANARNCDALKGCSSSRSESGCSRLAYFRFGTEGDPNYQCLDNVENNTVCGPRCTQRIFDFSRGFEACGYSRRACCPDSLYPQNFRRPFQKQFHERQLSSLSGFLRCRRWHNQIVSRSGISFFLSLSYL